MDLTKGIDSLAIKLNLQEFIDTIDYRVARSREELEKAYALVYQEYLKRGYAQKNQSGLRFSLFNALPQATTFIAVSGEEILATASVIPDSPCGLPMDTIYRQETDSLFRQKNKKICEVSMLASRTELFRDGVSVMLNAKKLFFIFFLFKAVFDYVRFVLEFDYMCITLNPKHSLTYDFLLFKDFGGLKSYGGVGGAPAIAKSLEVNTAEEECRRLNRLGLYKMFFKKRTDEDKFNNKITFTPEDLRYFFVEKSDIFKNAPGEQMGYVKQCYPRYDFSLILSSKR